jgi:hypothetical protein
MGGAEGIGQGDGAWQDYLSSGGLKSEIRSPKSETNPEFEGQRLKNNAAPGGLEFLPFPAL